MNKKSDKATESTVEADTTSLYEVSILFDRLENGPICHFDGEGWSRLVTVLEGEDNRHQVFFGLDLIEEPKRECYINLTTVVKINILDCLAGLPAKKRPKLTYDESAKQLEEREASEDTIILRVWMTYDKAVDLYYGIDYEDWISIRLALEENNQQFIGFTDDDGERVLLSVAHIGAIEAFDTHYLSDQDIDQIFETKEDNL